MYARSSAIDNGRDYNRLQSKSRRIDTTNNTIFIQWTVYYGDLNNKWAEGADDKHGLDRDLTPRPFWIQTKQGQRQPRIFLPATNGDRSLEIITSSLPKDESSAVRGRLADDAAELKLNYQPLDLL